MSEERDFVSVAAFAARVALSGRTVWKLVRAADIPSIKVGGRRLIPLRDGLEALRRLGELGARDARVGDPGTTRRHEALSSTRGLGDRHGRDHVPSCGPSQASSVAFES